MEQAIHKQLHNIAAVRGIRILYACESGSRAWGFPSPDSDYDVRFVYAHPAAAYLSIREAKDVIELPIDELLDIGGWDLRKTLQLFLKSNAPLYEWLQSPIVYQQQGSLVGELRSLMPRYFSRRAACHHYLSMARNTFRELQGPEVRLKKYFYALRPLLAALWVLERKEVPPMQFDQLRTLIANPHWQAAVSELLEQKRQSNEQVMVQPSPLLQEWIEIELMSALEKGRELPSSQGDISLLDEIFNRYIQPL